MNSVAGIFFNRAAAQSAIDRLRALGVDEERMLLLSPGTPDERVEQTAPVIDTEAGTGEKIGSSVGRGAGIAGGIMVGGAVGSIFVPGVGAVVAAGVLGAALLGTIGAAIGAAAGGAVDAKIAATLRHDELHLYEAALRQGRSVLVAVAVDESQAQAAHEALREAGSESLDEAREIWWNDMRAAEEESYRTVGRDLAFDENLYRRGFEAALHPRARGLTFIGSAPFPSGVFWPGPSDRCIPKWFRTRANLSAKATGKIPSDYLTAFDFNRQQRNDPLLSAMNCARSTLGAFIDVQPSNEADVLAVNTYSHIFPSSMEGRKSMTCFPLVSRRYMICRVALLRQAPRDVQPDYQKGDL